MYSVLAGVNECTIVYNLHYLFVSEICKQNFPVHKDAHTVYTNTRSCPPASQKLYFRVPLPKIQGFLGKSVRLLDM